MVQCGQDQNKKDMATVRANEWVFKIKKILKCESQTVFYDHPNFSQTRCALPVGKNTILLW